jgi:REP element-mobilizing transposase RayT
MRSRCGDEVRFPKHLRPIVGRAIRDYLETHGHRVLAVAVGRVHAHVVTELPDDIRTIKQILGEAKRKSSRAVKKELPGKVWSAGAEKKPVDTKAHLGRAVDYVLYEQGEGAWTWSFRDRDEEGKFGRRKPKPKLGPALRSGPP